MGDFLFYDHTILLQLNILMDLISILISLYKNLHFDFFFVW